MRLQRQKVLIKARFKGSRIFRRKRT